MNEKREDYGDNVRYKFRLINTKEITWTGKNEQIIERLSKYAKKKMID